MSLDVPGWLLAIALLTAPQTTADTCAPASLAALAAAAVEVGRGEQASAVARVRAADEAGQLCRPLRLAAWAFHGWLAALAAGDRGGTPEALAPVTEALQALTALGPASLEARYAGAWLRAAAAAAQDERDEMLVWMEEARALSTRLAFNGAAPSWPLPVDLAEGELWHGVDDYELAEAAFTRALVTRETALAWRGLARARDRRGNKPGACEAYRRVAQMLAGETPPAALAVEARGYLLLCVP